MKAPGIYLLAFLVAFFAACSGKHSRTVLKSYYFWKTSFNVDEKEQQGLKDRGVGRLYIRVFDVVWDTTLKVPKPVAPIRFLKPVDTHLELVPVVFIRNEVFAAAHLPAEAGFSDSLVRGIRMIMTGKHFKEVELDCDWTEGTKDAYFEFLKKTKALLNPEGVNLSVTIRLHQVKYFKRMGVPPVDSGMLMFYNMGNVKEESTNNPVYDEQTASAYLYNFETYPLPLDIALACYQEAAIFEQGKLRKLVDLHGDSLPEKKEGFRKTGSNRYEVTAQTSLEGIPLSPGTHIRLDGLDPAECLKSARQIQPYLKQTQLHVAIFSLENYNPSDYEKETIEAVYHQFN
jgi:hypothetical protein